MRGNLRGQLQFSPLFPLRPLTFGTNSTIIIGPGSFAELYLCGAVPSCTWLKCTIVATHHTVLALSAARWPGASVLGA